MACRIGPDLLALQQSFQDNTQGRYDGSLSSGNHTFRFGLSYNRTAETVFANFFGLAPRIRGTLNSTGIAFANAHGGAGNPLNFQLNQIVLGNGQGAFRERPALGFPNGGTTNNRIGVYFTDGWKVKGNFTLTLGLQYDYDSALAIAISFARLSSPNLIPNLAGSSTMI
jgi:outer membrane receptor protein involved in Fe transport